MTSNIVLMDDFQHFMRNCMLHSYISDKYWTITDTYVNVHMSLDIIIM